jgi:poly(3-hydroxybutyrate) depolymerase
MSIELNRARGAGHQWPGGRQIPGLGTATHGINGSLLMWRFFSRYSLPTRNPAR